MLSCKHQLSHKHKHQLSQQTWAVQQTSAIPQTSAISHTSVIQTNVTNCCLPNFVWPQLFSLFYWSQWWRLPQRLGSKQTLVAQKHNYVFRDLLAERKEKTETWPTLWNHLSSLLFKQRREFAKISPSRGTPPVPWTSISQLRWVEDYQQWGGGGAPPLGAFNGRYPPDRIGKI